MKVLFLVNSFPSDSFPSKSIFNLRAAQQLSVLCELMIVTIRIWLPGRPVIEKYEFKGQKVVCLYLPSFPNPKYTWQLRFNKFIRSYFGYILLPSVYKKDIQIVHSVEIAGIGPIGSIWAKKLKAFSVAQCIGSDINYELKKFNPGTFGIFLEPIDGLICNSKDLFNKTSFLSSNNLLKKVEYRGIDSSLYKKIQIIRENRYTFLYLGGFPQYHLNKKGGMTLLKAIEQIEGKLVSKNIKFFIGGLNSTSSKIIEIKNRLKHSELVQLLGKIKPDEVFEYLTRSDIVIIPSLEEGLPNVLLEASLYGKPCIGSNVGGIPEVIDHKVNGILVEPGNVLELAESILWCEQNKEKASYFGEKIREKVLREFNGADYGRRILSFYEQVLKLKI